MLWQSALICLTHTYIMLAELSPSVVSHCFCSLLCFVLCTESDHSPGILQALVYDMGAFQDNSACVAFICCVYVCMTQDGLGSCIGEIAQEFSYRKGLGHHFNLWVEVRI